MHKTITMFALAGTFFTLNTAEADPYDDCSVCLYGCFQSKDGPHCNPPPSKPQGGAKIRVSLPPEKPTPLEESNTVNINFDNVSIYECDVTDIDDETCELSCDGPGSDDYSCVCDDTTCDCSDAASTWTMTRGAETSWCPELRRGGGEICFGGGNLKVCFKLANPNLCTPCVNGCVEGDDGYICL